MTQQERIKKQRQKQKHSPEEYNSRVILAVLTGISCAFLAAAFLTGDGKHLISGLIRINAAPSQFTRDYFKLGGLGSTFLNTGLIGLFCCMVLALTKSCCSGLTVAAYWLTVGFGSFGMTVMTILPFFFGTFVYTRIRKVPYKNMVHIAMFSTALAPFAGELIWRYPTLDAVRFSLPGLMGALLLGAVTGCVMPALCAHSPAFHKGFDLYNAGPAAGFLAFLFYCILYRVPGIEVPSNTDLGEGEKLFVSLFFLVVFLCLMLLARILDPSCFSGYRKLIASDGYGTDFCRQFGIGPALLNMSLYGLFILAYYFLIRGFAWSEGSVLITGARFTGATMGAIMCMSAFSCHGAHPRTVFPIMIGYALASCWPFLASVCGLVSTQSWTLTTQSILVGLCFASGLAPVAGRFGFWPGVTAGAIHALLVTSVPLLHGGFCLYNGGFTAGITAFLLVPVLEHFSVRRKSADGGKQGEGN